MRIALFFIYLLVVPTLWAQATFVAVKDEVSVRKEFALTPTKINALKSAFTQEKNLKALADKLISKGVFYFEKSNKVRLEYQTPYPYLMVMNNGKLMIKENGKTTKMDLRSNKVFEQVNRIMTDCVSGNALNNPDFATKILENSTQYKLEMTPQTKGLKDYFSVIQIYIDKKDFTAARLELIEKTGDSTVIYFSSKELNKVLDAALFKIG